MIAFSATGVAQNGQTEDFKQKLSPYTRILLLEAENDTIPPSEKSLSGSISVNDEKGWEVLTDSILSAVAQDPTPKVFMLWGNYAQSKETLIESVGNNHLVLKANHPSPLSALRPPVPFIGCGHFSKANDWLCAHNEQPIDWAQFSLSEPVQQSLLF